jgi:hypothetical protein
VKYVPGLLGAALVVAGVALLSIPFACIVAGGFLLLVDRRIP